MGGIGIDGVGIDINARTKPMIYKNKASKTALILAAQNGHYEVR